MKPNFMRGMLKHNISYLFLRGLSRNQFHWYEKDSYEKILQNEVHFLDLPGFGLNQKKYSPTTIRGIRRKLQDDWRHYSMKLDPNSKKVIVGMSLGGLVAMNWASVSKEWDALVMINSSTSDLSWPWERLNPKAYLPFVKGFVLKDSKKWEESIFDVTCNYDLNKKKIVEDWTEIRKTYPIKNLNLFNQLNAASAYKSPKTMDTPGLVLTSTRDRLVSFRCSKKIAKKFDFEIKISRASGHDLSVDAKDWMLNHIKSFSEKTFDLNKSEALASI